MMKNVALTFATAVLFALCGVAFAQSTLKADPEAAKSKVSMCIGCHGIAGYKTAYPVVYSVPMIGGQSPDYLAKALQAYRAGDRSHPSMLGIAKSLSDQDIADLAAYYGKAK
jgi:cytochrome c553